MNDAARLQKKTQAEKVMDCMTLEELQGFIWGYQTTGREIPEDVRAAIALRKIQITQQRI